MARVKTENSANLLPGRVRFEFSLRTASKAISAPAIGSTLSI